MPLASFFRLVVVGTAFIMLPAFGRCRTFASVMVILDGLPLKTRAYHQSVILLGIRYRRIQWLDYSSLTRQQYTIGSDCGGCTNIQRKIATSSPDRCLFSTSSTETESDKQLTRTAIRRMKVKEIKKELSNRGLDTAGKKMDLVKRLQEWMESLRKQDDNISDTAVRTNQPIPTSGKREQLAKRIRHVSKPDFILDDDDGLYFDDIMMAHYNKTPAQAWPRLTRRPLTPLQEIQILSQSVFRDENVAKTSTTGLDPKPTYVIRIQSVPSGQRHFLETVVVRSSLLVKSDDDHGSLSLLETNQVVLPGKESPDIDDLCSVIVALRQAKIRGIQNLIVEMDNIALIRQLNGQGQIEAGYHEELHQKILELKHAFESFQVRKFDESEEGEDMRNLANQENFKQKSMQEANVTVEATDNNASPANCNSVIIDPMKEYLLRFDGGARGNPSDVAGAGMVLYDSDREVWCGWKYLGKEQTNNIAEYSALIEGLRTAHRLGIKRLRAEGDSELVVKQVLGEYKVKKDWLRPLHREAKELAAGFDFFSLAAIPRAENSRADYLANQAMDSLKSWNNTQKEIYY